MKSSNIEPKTFFLNIFLLTLLLLTAQTEYEFTGVLDWFNWFIGSFFIHFVIFIIIILFFFAVIKAPLDTIRKSAFLRLSLPLLLLGETYDFTGFIISTSKAFWSLLALLFIFILPLFLILLLYKAFIKVVKA